MIYLGADHAGFELKEEIKKYLNELNMEFEDLGNEVLDKDDDYPDFAKKVAEKVREDENNRGILFCGSGAGMCISANKIKGIRAAVGTTEKEAEFSRKQNNNNILCLGGRILDLETAKKCVKTWLETEFKQEERHVRRLEKIKKIEGF